MSKLNYKQQKRLVLFLFLLIPITLLLVFTYYPAIRLIYLSFMSWDGVSLHPEFIAWKNYWRIFRDPSFFEVLSHNLYYFVIGILQVFLALFFAILLHAKLKATNFFRTVLFMPYILNSVAVAFMFTFFLNNQYGGLNIMLRSIGLEQFALNWLGDPKLVNITLAFMALWKYMGYMMVVFLGGLQSISPDIYESASMDGATGWQAFRHITLPGIKHILKLNLFLNLNGALAMFEMPFAMYNGVGSPMGMADTFAVKTVITAFTYHDFGLASALGVVLMIITAILVFLQNKVFFREEN